MFVKKIVSIFLVFMFCCNVMVAYGAVTQDIINYMESYEVRYLSRPCVTNLDALLDPVTGEFDVSLYKLEDGHYGCLKDPWYSPLAYVELGDYWNIDFQVEAIAATTRAEAKDYLEEQWIYIGDWFDVLDGNIEYLDTVSVSLEISEDGENFDVMSDVDDPYVVGGLGFELGLEDSDLSIALFENLIGLSVGDEYHFSFDVPNLPDKYSKYAGKSVIVRGSVLEVSRISEMTDETVCRISNGDYQTVDSLIDYFQEHMDDLKLKDYRNTIINSFSDALTDVSVVKTIPASLFDYQISNTLCKYEYSACASGLFDLDSIDSYIENMTNSASIADFICDMRNKVYNEHFLDVCVVTDAIFMKEHLSISESDYRRILEEIFVSTTDDDFEDDVDSNDVDTEINNVLKRESSFYINETIKMCYLYEYLLTKIPIHIVDENGDVLTTVMYSDLSTDVFVVSDSSFGDDVVD